MTKSTPKKVTKVSAKTAKQAHAEHQLRHRITLGAGIIVIAVLLALVLVLLIIPRITNDARLARINQIYSSIVLPSPLYNEQDNVFGDKRPYEWDSSRTYSSSKTFVVGQNVDTTFNEIDKAIRAAGYTYFEEPYPGAVMKEYHYKSAKGEYVRLSVESKLRLDAFQNAIWMGKSTNDASASFNSVDPNAGPSLVTLKVNLDDNNE